MYVDINDENMIEFENLLENNPDLLTSRISNVLFLLDQIDTYADILGAMSWDEGKRFRKLRIKLYDAMDYAYKLEGDREIFEFILKLLKEHRKLENIVDKSS